MRSRLTLVALSLFFYGCGERISPDIRSPDSSIKGPPVPISKIFQLDHPPDLKQVSQTFNQKFVNVLDSSAGANPEDAIVLPVMGHVYHWSSHALLSDVSVRLINTLHAQPDNVIVESQTDKGGRYQIDSVALDEERSLFISAERELAPIDSQRAVTSADALAALKIAVGINPNIDPDGSGPLQPIPVSPYQFIAADINQDGRVTSSDALEILKNAVNLPTAIRSVWLFLPESHSFWDSDANEGSGAYLVDNQSITQIPTGIALNASNAGSANFVALRLGDVDGSWESSGATSLTQNYFEALLDKGVSPLSQWGLAGNTGGSNIDSVPPVVLINGEAVVFHQQGMPYIDEGATAQDDRDGEIPVRVDGAIYVDLVGAYRLQYTAIDSAGNQSIRYRRVVVDDRIPPVMQLLGDALQVHEQGTPYLDDGATALDGVDDELDVTVSAVIDSSTAAGTYTVIYSATDLAGNVGGVSREVRVIAFRSAELFFSEYSAGSGNNRYLEIYNPSIDPIELGHYAFPSAHDGADFQGMWDVWNDFPGDAVIGPSDVYVICDPQSNSAILEQCDLTFEGFVGVQDSVALVKGVVDGFLPVDRIGSWEKTSGSDGWSVCGQTEATSSMRLIKKPLTNGAVDWEQSAGSSASDCAWNLRPHGDFSQLGTHDYSGEATNTTDFVLSDSRAMLTDYNPSDGDFESDEFDINLSSTVFTLDLQSAPLNLDNLNNGANGMDYRESSLSFPITSLPVGQGSATFDLEMTTGVDGRLDSGESQLRCQIALTWISDGINASIDEPEQTIELSVIRSGLKLWVSIGSFDILGISDGGPHFKMLDIKLLSALSEAVKLDAGLFASLLTPRTLHLKMRHTLPIINSDGVKIDEVNAILRLQN